MSSLYRTIYHAALKYKFSSLIYFGCLQSHGNHYSPISPSTCGIHCFYHWISLWTDGELTPRRKVENSVCLTALPTSALPRLLKIGHLLSSLGGTNNQLSKIPPPPAPWYALNWQTKKEQKSKYNIYEFYFISYI